MKFKQLLLANLLVVLSTQSVAATITAVRSWRAPDNTRIVLDLSEPVRYHQVSSTNKQIIIDIENTDITVPAPSWPTRIGLLQNVQFQADGTNQRLVINLSDEVRPNVFLLPANDKYKARLVIDLFDKVTMQTSAPPPEEESDAKDTNNGRAVIVAVDAGHGGEDSGAIGASGHYEKHVTLAIAKKLVATLRKTDGFKAYLTRDDDYFIPLQDRRTIARNRYKADIFISIHADSAPSPLAKGASVFALSRKGATTATSRFAQALAEHENKSDLIGGVDSQAGKDSQLTNILADMVVEGSLTQSLHMGNQILTELDSIGQLHSKHIEQAGFAVLKEPGMISVLVETGFISNPSEEEKLIDPDQQQKIAQSVLTGVQSFLQKYPMPKTYFAWRKEQRSSKQKARALREVIALPEPKAVIMTADKLIDTPKTTVVMPAKDTAPPINKALTDNTALVDINTIADKTLAPKESKANKLNAKEDTKVIPLTTTKHAVVAATLPSSLDDFMGGVSPTPTKSEAAANKSNEKKAEIKSDKTIIKPKETLKTDIKKPAVKPIKHTVVQGDSLSSIAMEYHLTMDDLKAWNHLKSDNALLGTTLRLTAPESTKANEKLDKSNEKSDSSLADKPSLKGKDTQETLEKNIAKKEIQAKTHLVKVGDSLSDLAVRYGVSKQAIRDANKLKDDNVLLGQTLKIPTP